MATILKLDKSNLQKLKGVRGEKGDTGPKGDKGDIGPQGPVGSAGESIIGPRVSKGYLVNKAHKGLQELLDP